MASLLVSSVAAWVLAGPVFDPGTVRTADGDTPAQLEVFRIQRHLRAVEASLRAATPEGLDAEQRARREDALDALHAYRVAGEFPRNVDYPDRRVPYFIDGDGTACAVGQLMIASGDDRLAREIATYENNDFLADIDHPDVLAWLVRNGLTFEEAAWIQPSYGPCGFDQELVCGSDGNTYLCPYVAETCAGVEIAHTGPCGGGTGTGTDGGGDIIGEEACPASDSTQSSGSVTTESESDGTDNGGKGCSVGTAPPTEMLLLVALGGTRRRRRG